MVKEIILVLLAYLIGLYLGAVLMCTHIHSNNADFNSDTCGSCWALKG